MEWNFYMAWPSCFIFIIIFFTVFTFIRIVLLTKWPRRVSSLSVGCPVRVILWKPCPCEGLTCDKDPPKFQKVSVYFIPFMGSIFILLVNHTSTAPRRTEQWRHFRAPIWECRQSQLPNKIWHRYDWYNIAVPIFYFIFDQALLHGVQAVCLKTFRLPNVCGTHT